MTIGQAIDAAEDAVAILGSKEKLAPIIAEAQSMIADFELALGHAAKVLDGLKAVLAEVQPSTNAAP